MKISIPAIVLATTSQISALGLELDTKEESLATFDLLGESWNSETTTEVESTLTSVVSAAHLPIQQLIGSSDNVWDRAAEQRFHDLAVKEALETIVASELKELEVLSRLRRKETASSVSGDEVLRELKQWRRTLRLLDAFQEYVATIPHPAKPASHS